MSWLIIGVDPGPTPGIVAFHEFEGDAETYVVQCNHGATMFVLRSLFSLPRPQPGEACQRILAEAVRARVPRTGGRK